MASAFWYSGTLTLREPRQPAEKRSVPSKERSARNGASQSRGLGIRVVRPTGNQLEGYLREQFDFLCGSVEGFLAGNRAEALRVAVTMRLLVHKTTKSHPLLEQLDRDYLSMLTPDKAGLTPGLVEEAEKGNVYFYWPIPMSTSGSVTAFEITYGDIPLREWWSGVPALIFGDERIKAPRAYTRKDLVLVLANQEGGAHIDPEGVPEDYARLITDRPARISGQMTDTINGARWIVAQSGVELAYGLQRRYPMPRARTVRKHDES